jgi:DNA-binding NarL/FixJ family response regulator
MNGKNKYLLSGYIELLPIEMGFVTPIFSNGQQLFIQNIDSECIIVGFEQIPENIEYQIESSTCSIQVGDKCLFAFKHENVQYDSYENLVIFFNKQILQQDIKSNVKECIYNFIDSYNDPENIAEKENVLARKRIEWKYKSVYSKLKVNASVAIVDDHILLRKGLVNLIRGVETYAVLFEAENGKDFIKLLQPKYIPDIVLLDINMPEMDGYDTALWLKKNYPNIKILALSMNDNESSIIRMMKNGAQGYILKDIDPLEFRNALDSLMRRGFYYSELVTGNLIKTVNQPEEPETLQDLIHLNAREIEFLKLVCTELTYKEIAEKMFLSVRTIDGFRDALFEKLNVKSRVGLVIYAIKNGLLKM